MSNKRAHYAEHNGLLCYDEATRCERRLLLFTLYVVILFQISIVVIRLNEEGGRSQALQLILRIISHPEHRVVEIYFPALFTDFKIAYISIVLILIVGVDSYLTVCFHHPYLRVIIGLLIARFLAMKLVIYLPLSHEYGKYFLLTWISSGNSGFKNGSPPNR